MKYFIKNTFCAKPANRRLNKVVGWPKPYHLLAQKRGFWQTIRAMLF
ncbi:MAG: hypothetical protein NTZ18_03545 [Candidatus Komeilibacteria bacterium]|nr:hypothetical protein [Candidatus Komeilibacteria bacterium]